MRKYGANPCGETSSGLRHWGAATFVRWENTSPTHPQNFHGNGLIDASLCAKAPHPKR